MRMLQVCAVMLKRNVVFPKYGVHFLGSAGPHNKDSSIGGLCWDLPVGKLPNGAVVKPWHLSSKWKPHATI